MKSFPKKHEIAALFNNEINIYSVERATINRIYQHPRKVECTVMVESEHYILNEDVGLELVRFLNIIAAAGKKTGMTLEEVGEALAKLQSKPGVLGTLVATGRNYPKTWHAS